MKVLKKRSKSYTKLTPSNVLSIGHYDIDYSITLTDDDVLKYQIDDITKLTTVEDISFIIGNQSYWERIQMNTNNNSITLLLYLNKICFDINKLYIEYVAFEKPMFYNDSVKLMLKTVNDFNFFFVNETPLTPDAKKYFSLTVKYKDKQTVINFDKSEEDDKNNNIDNEIQKEGSSQEKPNEENNEKNEAKGENPFDKIKLDCSKYNYFICSIDDGLEISSFNYFIDFVIFVKLNFGALVTIEYTDVSDCFLDKESMALLNKLFLMTDIFLFDEKDAINNFRRHYDIFTKENCKQKYFDEKENECQYSSDNICQMYLEDDKNQMTPQLNINIKLYLDQLKYHSIRKRKENAEKDMLEYFRNILTCNGSLSILNSKLGIFIDQHFSKITFLEVPMNIKATILTYDIKPYPKLSHTTVDLVELYRGVLKIKRGFFKHIFYAGILNKIFFLKRKSFGIDVLYSGYLTGHEILKRILHFVTSEIPLPDNPKFYLVKINYNEVNEYVKKHLLNKKENKFVLDCTNAEKSKMKHYVPLFDYNLHEYFENKDIQKELANKGFIDSKGFVNYDPIYRIGMGVPKKKYNRNASARSPNYLVKKQVEKNVKNMKHRILKHTVLPTKIKLPKIQCKVTEKISNYYKLFAKDCSHGYSQKCQYCELYERAKIEIDIEEEKRKQMQLRRYKVNK